MTEPAEQSPRTQVKRGYIDDSQEMSLNLKIKTPNMAVKMAIHACTQSHSFNAFTNRRSNMHHYWTWHEYLKSGRRKVQMPWILKFVVLAFLLAPPRTRVHLAFHPMG